jgi:hypothetical protein
MASRVFSVCAIINETECKMNPGPSLRVPVIRASLVTGLLLFAGACLGPPDLESGSDPLVVTEAGASNSVSPERAAAIAEMREKGAAAESAGYPPAFQTDRTRRFAAREEPRAVSEAEAIERELATVAAQRKNLASPDEIAAMEARAAELRRLRAQAQAGAEADTPVSSPPR